MLKCKNSEYHFYTGKENTPLGRGFCSQNEEVDKIMKGNDNSMYIVKNFNNENIWTKYKKITHHCKCNPCRCNPCRCNQETPIKF